METNKKILLVEDDGAISDAISMMFQGNDFKLETHKNGDKILTGSYEVPDLFILDKQLPGVDGLSICRFLRSQPISSDKPIIILSASLQVGALAREAGATDFLEKPFTKQALLEMTARYLK